MISLLQISDLIKGQLIGDPSLDIKGVCDIEKGKESCITYLRDSKYKKYIKNNIASAFIVSSTFNIKK